MSDSRLSTPPPPPTPPEDHSPADPPPPYNAHRPRRSRFTRHPNQNPTINTNQPRDSVTTRYATFTYPIRGRGSEYRITRQDSERTPIAGSSRRSESVSTATLNESDPGDSCWPSPRSLRIPLFSSLSRSEASDVDDEEVVARLTRPERMPFSWKRYFRPIVDKSCWAALSHLLIFNFPYALAAWIYLFVFTVTGTTLLVALPLGAVLCFFNLLGARAFARGELAIQRTFYDMSRIHHPYPYPPRPLFSRYRLASREEIEDGRAEAGDIVQERSFYRNTYSMFTDSISYQALFYFLVVKPAITLVFGLPLLILVPVCTVIVFPLPLLLRAVRKAGLWQAGVATEGLYVSVR